MQISKINFIQNNLPAKYLPKQPISNNIAFKREDKEKNFSDNFLNLFSKRDVVVSESPKEIYTKNILENAAAIWEDAINNEYNAYEKAKELKKLYSQSIGIQKEALSKIKKSEKNVKSKTPVKNNLTYQSKTGDLVSVDYIVHSKGISIVCISIKKDSGLKDEISFTWYRFPHEFLNDYFSNSANRKYCNENIFQKLEDSPICYSRGKKYNDNVEYTCKEEFDFLAQYVYYEDLLYHSTDKAKKYISFDKNKKPQSIRFNSDGDYAEEIINYNPMSVEVKINSKPNEDGIVKNQRYLFSNNGHLKEYEYFLYSKENNDIYSGTRFILRNNKIVSRTAY